MICCYAYFDLTPLIWLGGLVVVISLAIGLTKKYYSVGAVVVVAGISWTILFWLQNWLFVGVEQLQSHEMSWSTDGPAEDRVTTLRYLADPNFYELCRSNEVARWLDYQKPKTVQLFMETTWDYGKLRAAGNKQLYLNGEPLSYRWIDRPVPWHLLHAKH